MQRQFGLEIKSQDGLMAKGWLGLWESVLMLAPKFNVKIVIFKAKVSTPNSAAELVLLGNTVRDTAGVGLVHPLFIMPKTSCIMGV